MVDDILYIDRILLDYFVGLIDFLKSCMSNGIHLFLLSYSNTTTSYDNMYICSIWPGLVVTCDSLDYIINFWMEYNNLNPGNRLFPDICLCLAKNQIKHLNISKLCAYVLCAPWKDSRATIFQQLVCGNLTLNFATYNLQQKS